MEIRQAGASDVQHIAPLFDAYRQFYGQPSDLERALAFLADRIAAKQSTIFVAITAQAAVGFVQLYPSFSSVRCARTYILNDLFVAPGQRRKGIGEALLTTAATFGRETGADRLTLSTGTANQVAQALYERLGWVRSDAFLTYNLTL